MSTENAGCPPPVIPNGFADTSLNGTAFGSHAIVHCDEGFNIKQKRRYYRFDYERYNITCHKFGYWVNIPTCVPKGSFIYLFDSFNTCLYKSNHIFIFLLKYIKYYATFVMSNLSSLLLTRKIGA